MEEILGSVGIPSAVNIENGSHAPKTNDVSVRIVISLGKWTKIKNLA